MIDGVVVDGHRVLALEPLATERPVARYVAGADRFVRHVAAAAFAFSVAEVEGAATATGTGSFGAVRQQGQEVEYGVAFVGGMLEVVAVAGGTEGRFASGGGERAFVFGFGCVEVVVGFVLGHGCGRDGVDAAFDRYGAQVQEPVYQIEFVPTVSELKQRLDGIATHEANPATIFTVAIFRGVSIVDLGIFALSSALAYCSRRIG